jgi:hypothetical protein
VPLIGVARARPCALTMSKPSFYGRRLYANRPMLKREDRK